MSGLSSAAKGLHLYASIYALLLREPCTSDEIADSTGTTRREMPRTMRILRDRGVVHIQSWREGGFREQSREVWAAGGKPDARRPTTQKGVPSKRAARQRFRIEAFMFGLTLKALEDGADVSTIVELMGMHRHTAESLVRRMRTLRLIHVSEWIKPEFGGVLAVWKLGNKRNASRPKRVDQREKKVERDAMADLREQGRQFTHLIAAPLAQ